MATYIDVENISKRTMYKLNMVMKVAAFNLFRQVILKTPVDTGRARGNWQCTIVSSANGITNDTPQQAIDNMAKTVINNSVTKGMFLTNNLPYIQKLEYGGYGDGPKTSSGYSKQAPEGMVRISLKQIEADLSKIVQDVIEKGMKV